MIRKHLGSLLLGLALAGIACIPPATAQPALDMTPAKVRFGYITGPAFPTYIIAEELGYFRKQNLTIEKTFLNGAGAVSEALAAGNIDIGNTAPMASVLASAKGAKTLMVSGYEPSFTDKAGTPWEGVYVVVRSGEGIKTLQDLRGKRIAVNDIGSNWYFLLRAFYIRNNMNPDKDVSIVPVPFAQMAGALIQKQVDAVIATVDGYAQAKERIGVDLIGTHSSLENIDVALSSAVAVNTEYLRKNPDVVVRFLRAFIEARLWINNAVAKKDPAYMAAVAKSMKYTPQRADFFLKTRGGGYGKELVFVNLLDLPKRLIDRQLELLRLGGAIKPDAKVAYEETVDIRPLQRAYQTLGLKWDESKH
jgi:ABC-type nitrate/sulfonate/bicarbonate transport system substrate-binding protein